MLYSGTDGRMLEVEIFEGIIYYQRLRHMTADKWQVRMINYFSDTFTCYRIILPLYLSVTTKTFLKKCNLKKEDLLKGFKW